MKLIVAADAGAAASRAAQWIALGLQHDVAARGTALLALSGGRTPLLMLRELARAALPWESIRVAQVDERIVAADDDRRNARALHSALVERGPLSAPHFLAMPVQAVDLAVAAAEYALQLPAIDIVQLGLGEDGHTASLVPGDPLLAETAARVGISIDYQGTRRMTLTFAAINSARRIAWLVTGESKRARLAELLAGAGSSPAGQVRRDGAVVFADEAAAAPA